MSVGDIRVKDCYVFFYLCQQMERTTFRDRQGPLLRTRKKEMNLKPSRKLDKRSGRGMLYENEELRMRTIEISAEVDRGQSEVKKLRKENEMLKKEIWWLRDEYDKLEDVVKHMGNIDVSNNNPSAALEEYGRAEGATAATAISGGQQSWLQITEVQEDDEDYKHDKAKPPADLKFDQIDEDPDAEDSSAVPRMNLVRATLSPELDRQMQEDSFNLDHLLDIANSFNQDNAYGTLELYQSPLIQADVGAAGKNNDDEERRLGASEFAARRTFFQNKMDSPGSEEKPFATLSRRQAVITEKIRSNGCETQVIQEASLNRTRVIPSTDNNAISNAAGSSCEPASSNSGQTTVTVTTTCHSGVICSSDNGTVRYRSKSFLFLKPQLRSPSEPPLSTSAGNPSSHLAAGKFIQSPSGSSSSSSNSPQSPPPTYSAIASSRHSAPYMSPPSLSLLKSSLEGRPSLLDNLDSTSSSDNKPITSPVRVISRTTSRVKLSSPAPLIRLCSVDPNTIAIPLIAPSPTPSSTSTTTSATGMLGANEPTLDLVSASGNDPVHQHPPSDHRVSSSSSNACAAATAFSSYADVGAAATATATARAAFSSRRPELTDVTAEEVIDELDSQFGTPTDQLVRAVRVAPEGDVVYVCAATAKTKAAILNKGLSIRGIRVPLIPLAQMSRVAYLTGVPDHFSDSTVRVLLTAFAIPVGEVNRRYHRGVDTGDRLVRLLPRPTPSSATPSLTNEAQWTLEEIHLPKFVTAAGARICLSFVESTDSSTDVSIDGTISNVDNKRDSRRFFESARVAEVFSLYKSLPRANKPSASTPIKSIMREKSMSPSKSTPARDVDCRNLMPVVEIQEGKQQPAPNVDTPTKLLGDVNNPAFFKRGSSLMKREPTPNKKVTSPSSASTTKRPAPPVPSTPTNNTASRGSFMQEATRRLTSTFSRNEQPSTPGSAQPSTGNRHWSTVAGGRPSFLRRASGLVPAPSPMGSRRRFRRCTAGSFMVDDDVDCDSETVKSTADGDVISVKSYGSRSKDLPWCGCWGNGCF